MKFGLRTILIIVAVILFLIAVISDDNWADMVALGLAAFAASFIVDEVIPGGIGPRHDNR